ncbi:MAG: methyltransferase [Oligoflexia bacterium]|nr:methyltransferase [Oligoflexia bacterium]
MSDYFKGWAKPGPNIPDGHSGGHPEIPDVTFDALSGHYRVFQLKDGHRFSTDDLLAAWYGTSHVPCARTALDLGSGVGTVGMIAAWRLQGTRFVTVEAQDVSVALARRSAEYNGLHGRYEIRHGDFRDPALLAADEKFDLVLGSPPYFPLDAGIHGDHPQKIACRFEARGTVVDYCATAARHLALGGWFACVFPVNPEGQLKRVEEGARAAGLTIVRRRPIVLREGQPPLLAVFAMMRSEDLPESFRDKTFVEPALIIRRADGSIHPEYSVVKMSIGFPP